MAKKQIEKKSQYKRALEFGFSKEQAKKLGRRTEKSFQNTIKAIRSGYSPDKAFEVGKIRSEKQFNKAIKKQVSNEKRNERRRQNRQVLHELGYKGKDITRLQDKGAKWFEDNTKREFIICGYGELTDYNEAIDGLYKMKNNSKMMTRRENIKQIADALNSEKSFGYLGDHEFVVTDADDLESAIDYLQEKDLVIAFKSTGTDYASILEFARTMMTLLYDVNQKYMFIKDFSEKLMSMKSKKAQANGERLSRDVDFYTEKRSKKRN
jgi:hypothetical protein